MNKLNSDSLSVAFRFLYVAAPLDLVRRLPGKCQSLGACPRMENLLQNRYFCPFFRIFSLNSGAIRLKCSKNWTKNLDFSLRFPFSDKLLVALLLLLIITPLNAQLSLKENADNDQIIVNSPLQDAGQQNALKSIVLAQAVAERTVGSRSKPRVLYAEQWEISRSGEFVLSLPVLNQVVLAWLNNRQKKIEIQYPGGEAGVLWVHELTDWLVSLGIPSDHLVVVASSGADDIINFSLIVDPATK